MSKKRHKPEEIVAKLRQVEVLTAQGRTVAEAIRSVGITEVTFYERYSEILAAREIVLVDEFRGEDRLWGLGVRADDDGIGDRPQAPASCDARDLPRCVL